MQSKQDTQTIDQCTQADIDNALNIAYKSYKDFYIKDPDTHYLKSYSFQQLLADSRTVTFNAKERADFNKEALMVLSKLIRPGYNCQLLVARALVAINAYQYRIAREDIMKLTLDPLVSSQLIDKLNKKRQTSIKKLENDLKFYNRKNNFSLLIEQKGLDVIQHCLSTAILNNNSDQTHVLLECYKNEMGPFDSHSAAYQEMIFDLKTMLIQIEEELNAIGREFSQGIENILLTDRDLDWKSRPPRVDGKNIPDFSYKWDEVLDISQSDSGFFAKVPQPANYIAMDEDHQLANNNYVSS